MSSLRLKATKGTSRKLCGVQALGQVLPRRSAGCATATYCIAPSGTTLQPRSACFSVVTQPSTWPSRSHSWVKSWSSVMISSGRPWRASSSSAGRAQVAMLSALTAIEMRSSSRAPPDGAGRQLLAGRVPGRRAAAASGLVCLSSSWPADVGLSGRLRTMSTVPTWASSARSRCDTADWVIDSRCAARSKPPSSTMAARHSRASGSKVLI